jgi:hypothetical protein
MDPTLLHIFQTQVELQCRYALLAALQLDAAMLAQDGTTGFYALQNLLNAVANISKVCWGQRGKATEIRRPLRESIGVADTSALRTTTMRNNFEHIDERITEWWNESDSGHTYVE